MSSLPAILSVGHTSTYLLCNGADCCFVLAERVGWLALSKNIVLDSEYTLCIQFQEHLLALRGLP